MEVDTRSMVANPSVMVQLLVENVEEEVVQRLEKRAGKHGVSKEEELRRILRDVLAEESEEEKMSFKEFLMTMPDVGDDSIFERDRSQLPCEDDATSFWQFLSEMPDVGDDSIFERDRSVPGRATEDQGIYDDL